MQWLTTRQAPPLTFRSPGRIYGYARVLGTVPPRTQIAVPFAGHAAPQVGTRRGP